MRLIAPALGHLPMIALFVAAAAALNVSLVFIAANALTPKSGPLSTSGRFIAGNENAPSSAVRLAA
ncbi:hypothetical protein [Methylobacterium sp. J-068]|uniref:hypothetical protein n=1 Tax=Methylobacterium sp. J-068 TaxID=2836649 RepID=UPI001FB8815C|nr:hypothetical protein [Methylobacterium sp. J-068]MCJ2036545.1 hypothetical protein [Methylobacterium sp. J-068]